MSQEFYSQLHPSVQIELHRSPSQGSPQGPQSTSNHSSGGQHTGEAYREDSAGEDGKSESSSWKGDDANGKHSPKRDISCERVSGSSSHDDDEADNGRDGHVRLQLGMSCSNVHSVKTEPALVS
jgi:hypothetical protein